MRSVNQWKSLFPGRWYLFTYGTTGLSRTEISFLKKKKKDHLIPSFMKVAADDEINVDNKSYYDK